jgi:hypothetical protein
MGSVKIFNHWLSIHNGCQTCSFYNASRTKQETQSVSGNWSPCKLLEIEASEVDGISNEIKFLLPFTLFKTVYYICAHYHYICAELIPVNFSKKTRKATTNNATASADYSWEIHVISLTINSEGYINLS